MSVPNNDASNLGPVPSGAGGDPLPDLPEMYRRVDGLLDNIEELSPLLPDKSPISQNTAPFDEMGTILGELSEIGSQPVTRGELQDAHERLSHAASDIAEIGAAAAVMVQDLAQQHSVEAEEEFAVGVAAEAEFDHAFPRATDLPN